MIEPAGFLGIIPLHLTGGDGATRAGYQTTRIVRECPYEFSEEQHGQWGTEIPVTVVHLGKRLGPDEPLVELRHLLDDPLPGTLPKLTACAIEFCADGYRAEGSRCQTQLCRGYVTPGGRDRRESVAHLSTDELGTALPSPPVGCRCQGLYVAGRPSNSFMAIAKS